MKKLEPTGPNTVLVDMDGVIADMETPNNAIIVEHFPDVVPALDRTDFYFTDTYAGQQDVLDVVYEGNRRPGFFSSFPLVEGTIEGWHRMLEAGYTPRVCSSPLEDHKTVIEEKKGWLEEYLVPEFGHWAVDLAIFNRDKSGYDASSMIDDRPTLRNIERATWQHIVFSRSYNLQVETDFRLEDWLDPSLVELLDRAKEKYLLRGSQPN